MQKRFAVEIMFVILILFVIKGQSIRCYKCRSDVQTGCRGHMDDGLAEECPPKPNRTGPMCRKISQKLKFKDEEKWTIIRECAYEKGPDDCYNFKWVNLGYQITCECPEEMCNGESGLIPSVMIVAALFFLLRLITYLNCDNT